MLSLKRVLKYLFLIFVAIIFFSLSVCLAAESNSQKLLLDNGMAVVISEMPSSPMVSVYALVKVGSATEGEFLGSGITHFMEHMLFKGTKKRKVGEIAAKILSVGGTINASTGKDYTIYTITVPAEAFEVALDIQADILQNAIFDGKEMEKERKVIFNEMRLHEDNPSRKLSDLSSKNRYLIHPYQHPVIGYKDILSELKKDDFVKFYNKHYVPNNIVVSIAGNVDSNEILPQIKKAFGSFKRKSYSQRNLPQEPQQISPRVYEEEYPTELARVSISYPSVSLLNDDLFALDVLAKILGHGRSSRLYKELYDNKGLVHSIGAYNYTPIDQGEFAIHFVSEKENIEETVENVKGVISTVKESFVDLQELEKVKNQVISEFILGAQTSSEVAYRRATDQAFTGDHKFSEKYVEGIKNVAMEDVLRVSNEYLQEQRISVTILKPKSDNGDEQRSTIQKEDSQIKKVVLSNGIKLLLKKDATLPIVSIRLAGNGGLRSENKKNNGISQLMTSMLLKGTQKRTAEMISEDAEFWGMRFGAYSGRNSFGVSLQCLSPQIKEALDLFKDVIKNPTFPEVEIEKVKDLMRVGIRKRGDDISRITSIAMKELLFEDHFLGLETDGTLESISNITREDLVALHKELMSSDNILFSVFGDFDDEQIIKYFEDEFGALDKREIVFKANLLKPISKSIEKMVEMEKDQAMVLIAFRGSSLNDENRDAIEVMTTVLGSPFNGRLFSSIREELGNAYSVGGSFIPSIDSGIIYFYALTSADQAEKAKNMMMEEIEKMTLKAVDEKELNDAKEYLKGIFRQSIEDIASLGFTSTLDELYGLGYNHYLHYNDNMDQVTAQDVQRVSRQYLKREKAVIIVTMPKDSK